MTELDRVDMLARELAEAKAALAFAERRIHRLRTLMERLRYELTGRRWGRTG